MLYMNRGDGSFEVVRVVASNQSYKSGSSLDTHFGLGAHQTADVQITLLNGNVKTFSNLKSDQYLDLNLSNHQITVVPR